MEIALMQRHQQLILGLVAGVIKVDCDTGDRETLLTAQLDISLRAPRVERARENIDIFVMVGKGSGSGHKAPSVRLIP
jgi:hypothetical protein